MAIPLAATLGAHLVLERRAEGFAQVSARVLSMQPPAQPIAFRGANRHNQMDVAVQYVHNSSIKTHTFFLAGPEGAAFAKGYQAGDTVPIWLSNDEVQLTPPLRAAVFEWFAYAMLPVGLLSAMASLFLWTLRAEYLRLYGPQDTTLRSLR